MLDLNLKKGFKKITSSISVTFLTFPYLVHVFLNSDLNYELLLLSFLLILLDYLVFSNVKKYFFNIMISSSIIIFFYCKLIFNDTELTLHNLRFREFTLLFSLTSIVVTVFFFRFEEGEKMLNTFFFVFGLTFLFNTNTNKYFNQEFILNENKFKFENKLINANPSNSPVIFLLFDELSSTNEVFLNTKDSIDLFFDEELKKIGFEVIPDFKSMSTRTKFSMPSIFNFNLHSNSPILDSLENIDENVTIQKSYYWIASNNLLVDSLNKKEIKSTSYGLFPFKKGTVIENFIYWWPSFMDPLRIFNNSKFLTLFFQSSFLKSLESVLIESTTLDYFRKSVFDKLKKLCPEDNNFYYFHFYAPHEPYTWVDEYDSGNTLIKSEMTPEINLEEHIKFRRFFLKKVLPLVTSEKFKTSRIIIVGDHGFRFNKKQVDPKLTNIYLYNYPKEVIKSSDHVVQDLGYLILNSFN